MTLQLLQAVAKGLIDTIRDRGPELYGRQERWWFPVSSVATGTRLCCVDTGTGRWKDSTSCTTVSPSARPGRRQTAISKTFWNVFFYRQGTGFRLFVLLAAPAKHESHDDHCRGVCMNAPHCAAAPRTRSRGWARGQHRVRTRRWSGQPTQRALLIFGICFIIQSEAVPSDCPW